jgi:hypothetical protein
MTRKLTSQKYDAMVQRAERMADGIAKHKGEKNFPPVLDEAARRQMRNDLEAIRQKYEALAKETELAHNAYIAAYDASGEQLAKDDETVRGLYGKTNPIVADFGTKVLSAKRARKSAPKPPSAKA